MNVIENIRNALASISSNKLRSSLTMLGIIIGVASVVLLVAIGQGTQRSVTSRIQSLGTNLLTISPGSPTQTNVRFGGGGGGTAAQTLPMTDVTAIETVVPGLKGIEPEVRSRAQAIYGSKNESTSIVGTVPDYIDVRNAPLSYGRFITQQDIDTVAKVAVLGPTVVTNLFGTANPVGQDIRIGSSIFTVVGVMQSKGQQGATNADDMILIPLPAAQSRFAGTTGANSISVSVENAADMDLVQREITAVLLNEHRITNAAKQDFTVLNQADAVQTLNDVTGIFTLLLGGIAAISLLVGGIGVMNIMLVSVTERTREIGIRKAIGAKKKDILLQFLVEAVVLSVLGGVIGILLSLLGSFLVSRLASLDASISAGSVLLAFVFSICVGVFFGMLPAYKAAALRPIQALRYE